MNKLTSGVLLCCALISGGIPGCSAEENLPIAANADLAGDDPIRVNVIEPQLIDVVEPIFATGTVLAEKTTEIVPLVGGVVEEIFVRVGDRVEKGDPLLRMRQKDFTIAVERLQQAVQLAAAELENAERDWSNAVSLLQKRAISTEQSDDRQTRYKAALARLGIAKAELAEAEKELSDSITRAPYRGVITQRNIDEGAFIPSMMRTNQPALQIQKIDVMVAIVFVPQGHLKSIRLGTPGKVGISGLNNEYKTEVHLINDRIDAATRTIDVRLGIRNSDYKIKPGLFIEVELYPDPRPAVVIPARVVRGAGADRYVYVVQNDTVVQVPVSVRELPDGTAEVLSGLVPEQLVISGPDLHLIQDSDRVVVAADVAHVDF